MYESLAASGLTFATLVRYVCAGGMTVVGIPFYKNMGVHWTLTVLACLSALLAPIPYIFYKYGHVIRKKSKFATMREETPLDKTTSRLSRFTTGDGPATGSKDRGAAAGEAPDESISPSSSSSSQTVTGTGTPAGEKMEDANA